MFSKGKMESKKRGGQFDPFWDGQFAPFRVRKLPLSGVVSLIRFEVVGLTIFPIMSFNCLKGVLYFRFIELISNPVTAGFWFIRSIIS